jgi:coenzyme F420-dependent glucose-6-phosphate dehydrogenase
VVNARLFTLPETPPLSLVAAITAETAQWAGEWADGLITIARPIEELREVIDAFRSTAGEDSPISLQMQISFARDEELAIENAHEQWRTNIFESSVLSELPGPEHFEAAASFVRPEDLRGHVCCSADTGQHAEWIESFADLGVQQIFLHNVGKHQREFLSVFAEEVLPALSS